MTELYLALFADDIVFDGDGTSVGDVINDGLPQLHHDA